MSEWSGEEGAESFTCNSPRTQGRGIAGPSGCVKASSEASGECLPLASAQSVQRSGCQRQARRRLLLWTPFLGTACPCGHGRHLAVPVSKFSVVNRLRAPPLLPHLQVSMGRQVWAPVTSLPGVAFIFTHFPKTASRLCHRSIVALLNVVIGWWDPSVNVFEHVGSMAVLSS